MKKIHFTKEQAREFKRAAQKNEKENLMKNAKKLFSDGIISQ